ncbi:MAG TPA: phage shock protein PspA [Azospirillaceae bacterium]|nr:phage shock protein PspA [Azospirillaceae bacterium]
MGIFSRLGDIVNANLNALLDRAEDPRKMIRLIIQEMEDTLVEVRSATVQIIADKKEIERRVADHRREAEDWRGKAEIALTRGREDLAKGALMAKARATEAAEALSAQLADVDADLAKANEDIARLQAKLSEAKAREQTFAARAEVAQQRLRVRSTLHDRRVTEAFARFEQVERSLDELHGRVESYDLGGGAPDGRGPGGTKPLATEIAELETEHKVEQELAELKAKLAGRGGA